jgi:hypothetical protein
MNMHENLIDIQVKRLKKKGYPVHKHFTYKQHGIEGELDIMVEYPNDVREYYEIKSSHRPRCHNHAIHQFRNVKRAFPEYMWRFFYVTPNKVEQVSL